MRVLNGTMTFKKGLQTIPFCTTRCRSSYEQLGIGCCRRRRIRRHYGMELQCARGNYFTYEALMKSNRASR
jgi:hypothetical protein